jgi:alkylation response protein AidB-like acyl-CoA dehydrogenase
MRFDDSEAQKILRSTARAFLADAYPVERLYRIESGQELIVGTDLDDMADLGWFDLLAPDGDGASLLETAVVIEEFGYAGVPSPVAPINVAMYALTTAERLAATKRCTISEASRANAGRPPIVVSNDLAVGSLRLVPFAHVRDEYPFVGLSDTVLAPVTVDGETALAVLSLDGTQTQPLELMGRRCYSNVRFDGAPAKVVFRGARALQLRDQLDALTTAFGVIEMAGAMQRILEMTSEYVTNRVQFGQPIAKFQAARHRAAELLMQTETTRWAAYHALWRFQQDPSDTSEIWLTKHWAARAADRVYQIAHLLHGGVGVGLEYPLHLFTLSMSALAVLGGTTREMVDRTADALVGAVT